MTRRVLLLGLGRTGRPYLRRARERGLAVSVAERPSLLSGPEPQPLLGAHDALFPVPASFTEAYYAAGSKAVAADTPDGILAVSELQVVPAALLAAELDLPGPGLHAAVVSRNKLLQRGLFARHGIAQPEFMLAHSDGQALAWARGRYPVVVKPLSGWASEGVQIVADRGELLRWAQDRGAPYLVEDLCSGPEYSLEGVVDHGSLVVAGITAKTTTPPPYFVEIEHRVPATLPAAAVKDAGDLAHRVVAAARVGSGLIHLEFRLTPVGPVVMELAVRAAGDHIPDLVGEARGVDLYDAALALALCETPAPVASKNCAAIAWFPTAPPGVVRHVGGLQQVRALPAVVAAELSIRSGDTVSSLRSSADRLGAVLIRGRTPADAETTLARVRELLVVHTEPAP